MRFQFLDPAALLAQSLVGLASLTRGGRSLSILLVSLLPWTWSAMANAEAPYQISWVTQAGTSQDEHIYDFATDSLGNSYLAGFTWGNLGGLNAGDNDAFVTKYGLEGALVWTAQLGTSSYDRAHAVATNTAGDVYIAGISQGDLLGEDEDVQDAFLIKHDSFGNQLWAREVGSPTYDFLNAVAVDATGNVYVAGERRESAIGGSDDVLLVKLSSAGSVLWTEVLGQEHRDDEATSVVVDRSGNITIAGFTNGDLGGTSIGGGDILVSQFDPSGNVRWTRQLGTEATDYARDLAVDADGFLYISGVTEGDLAATNAGGQDAFVLKLDSTGDLQWQRQFGTPSNDIAAALAVDSSGNVYVGQENGLIQKLDPSGSSMWSQQLSTDQATAVISGMETNVVGGILVGGSAIGQLGDTAYGGVDMFVAELVPVPDVTTTSFQLTSAFGDAVGSPTSAAWRQNAIVHGQGNVVPPSSFTTTSISGAPDVTSMRDTYAGQFSVLEEAGHETTGEFWDDMRAQWQGEREQQLSTTLEGSFRINASASELRNVQVTLDVEGRAVGKGTYLIDNLGTSVFEIASSLLAHGVASGAVKEGLSPEIIEFLGAPALSNTLGEILPELEQAMNDTAESAFRMEIACGLRAAPSGAGALLDFGTDSIGVDQWSQTFTGIPIIRDTEDEPLGVDAILVNVPTNTDIQFGVDLSTLAATRGVMSEAVAVIESVKLTVTDLTDPYNPAMVTTWDAQSNEFGPPNLHLYPQLYWDAERQYEERQGMEFVIGGSFLASEFIGATVADFGSVVFDELNALQTADPMNYLAPIVDPVGFLADQSGVYAKPMSPAFYSMAVPIQLDIEDIVVTYALLCSSDVVAPEELTLSVWLELADGSIDILELDFADVVFAATPELIDGMGYWTGPQELRFDASGLDEQTGILAILLNRVDGSAFEGAMVIDNIYATGTPAPEPSTLLLLLGGLATVGRRR